MSSEGVVLRSTRSVPTGTQYRCTPAVSASIAQFQSTLSESDNKLATEACLLWLLSLAPDVDVGDSKEKQGEEVVVHWYCGRDGAGDCWDPIVLATRLLSFQRKDLIDQWRCRFEWCAQLRGYLTGLPGRRLTLCTVVCSLLASCCDCVREYQRAKLEFRER